MMLQWSSEFDATGVTWLCVAACSVLFLLMPGLVLLYSSLSVAAESSDRLGQAILLVAVNTIAWCLGLYSLSFGPSFGRVPDNLTSRGEVDFLQMMSAAEQVADQSQLIGRGGLIGGPEFMFFESLTPGGNSTEPLYTSRRPFHKLPHTAFLFFQMTLYLTATATVAAFMAPFLTQSRAIVFSLLWGTVVYCPMAHWVWGEGWLAVRGAVDFGGGLLHLSIGFSALAIVLIQRFRKATQEEVSRTIDPTDLSDAGHTRTSFAALACWAGSLFLIATLSMPVSALRAGSLLNTQVGIASSCVAWCLLRQFLGHQLSARDAGLGVVAGIAAIAGGSGLFLSQSAMLVGAFGGLVGGAVYSAGGVKNPPSVPRIIFAIQGAPAAVGLILTGLLAASGLGVRRWDGTVVTSLVDGDGSLLVNQAMTVAAVAMLSVVGTVLCFLPLQRRSPGSPRGLSPL